MIDPVIAAVANFYLHILALVQFTPFFLFAIQTHLSLKEPEKAITGFHFWISYVSFFVSQFITILFFVGGLFLLNNTVPFMLYIILALTGLFAGLAIPTTSILAIKRNGIGFMSYTCMGFNLRTYKKRFFIKTLEKLQALAQRLSWKRSQVPTGLQIYYS